MSIRHLFQTIAIIAIDVAVVVAMMMIPQIMMFGVLFGFPLLAFINSYILSPILQKYMPKEERDVLKEKLAALEKEEAEKRAAQAAADVQDESAGDTADETSGSESDHNDADHNEKSDDVSADA